MNTLSLLLPLMTAHLEPVGPPNIFIAIADDWSFGHAGAYGCKWVTTPGFDRVAKDGLLFNRAYTPNAKCAPSRACLLTGRNSWQLEEAANHGCFFPAKFRTFPESLALGTYTVGSTGKTWAPGVALDADGKKRQMCGIDFNKQKAKPPTPAISNNDYAANFADFMEARDKGNPWCFWYGATEPHRGYEYGSGVAKGGKKLTDIDRVPSYWPDNDAVRNDMLDYAYEVEHFDSHLVKMLAIMEKQGQLLNTIVIVTSDHGMPFPRVKGQAYEASNHIPLAIMYPFGIRKPGRIIGDYVSLIDIVPTITDRVYRNGDKQLKGMASATGRSLYDIFQSEKSGQIDPKRDHVLIGKERHDVGRPNDWGYPIRGIIKNETLLLRNYETERWPAGNPETGYLNCDGSPTKSLILDRHRKEAGDKYWLDCFGQRPALEMYNIKQDPDCVTNLINQTEAREQAKILEAQMIQELKAQADPRMFGNGKIFDDYTYAQESMRNFYNRYMKGEKLNAGWVNKSDFEKK